MSGSDSGSNYDLVCLSHLRWDFVTQRPQHLLTRCARDHRVYFIEEAIVEGDAPFLDVTTRPGGVTVVVAHLPDSLPREDWETMQEKLLREFLLGQRVENYVLWFYTPMALGFSRSLTPIATVYDCMDELSAFDGASPELCRRESELFARADLVFTGGQSLYESKKNQHPHVYAFPSSVDTAHFAQARTRLAEPADQKAIPHLRLGFFGVVDERFDLSLLAGVAELRSDWHWIIIGPVVKIDPESLPRAANIHYLGGKSYSDLPAYIAGWDVALLLFARNASTRFISPTKTPEYLAAGKPVVSTSIRDVIRPYGEQNLARIADSPTDFVAACAEALAEDSDVRRTRADMFLSRMSWDKTWSDMAERIAEAIDRRAAATSDSLEVVGK